MAYSFEIENKLKEYNYDLPSDIYIELFNPNISTQVNHVIYNAWDNYFSAWTSDGYHWRFQVHPVIVREETVVPHEDLFKVKKLTKNKGDR